MPYNADSHFTTGFEISGTQRAKQAVQTKWKHRMSYKKGLQTAMKLSSMYTGKNLATDSDIIGF